MRLGDAGRGDEEVVSVVVEVDIREGAGEVERGK
jgi:hypothetical protein